TRRRLVDSVRRQGARTIREFDNRARLGLRAHYGRSALSRAADVRIGAPGCGRPSDGSSRRCLTSGFTLRHFTALCLLAGAFFWSAPAFAQTASRPSYAGRQLAEVLRDLQSRGLKIVFSTELVRPDMKVTEEPRSAAPRKILDEVLKPHGLEVRSGAGGSLLVVRGPGKKKSTTQPSGGPGTITGTVIDAASGIPLPNVIVAARDASISTVTDANGAFTLTGLRLEPHTLFVSLIGFGLARPTVDVPASGVATITIPLASGTGAYTEA